MERTALDARGEPVTGGGAWAIRTKKWRDGRPVEVAWFDAEAQPMLARGDKAMPGFSHREVWSYDEHGNAVSRKSFGTDGRPALRTAGRYHEVRYEYDDVGRVTGDAFFGVDGQPVLYQEARQGRCRLPARDRVPPQAGHA